MNIYDMIYLRNVFFKLYTGLHVLEIFLKFCKHYLFATFRLKFTPVTVTHNAFLGFGAHYLQDFLLVITLD